MFTRIYDALSNLRPRQLFLLSAASAIFIFVIMWIGLRRASNSVEPLPINAIGAEESEQNQPEIKMIPVVVSNRNIEAKSMIVSSMLATKEIPEDKVPQDAVLDAAEISNKPAKVRILKDEVITRGQVYANIEQSGFVGSIPPDCRAVSISLSDVTGVAGFAKPGDYVDVLLIEQDDSSVTSRLILQNVLLLSINKSMNVETAPPPPPAEGEGDGQQQETTVNPATQAIENPALATLALRPDEVLKLVSAAKLGDIYLMLRPLVPDGNYYTGAEYTVESLRSKHEREAQALQKQQEQEMQANQRKHELEMVSIKEAMQGKKDSEVEKDKYAETRIEILYGDTEKREDTNKQ